MDLNLSFHPSLNPSVKPSTEDKAWDKVLERHKQMDFIGVIKGIIDYADPSLSERSWNADKKIYDIPHGSISLQLRITEDNFEVDAPFLSIKDSKRIPIMRKVTEMNFSPLNLSAIYLDGDMLSFRYYCPLQLCEPYKTYDALREICVYADSYDDEFIEKFGASWIRPPQIYPYSREVMDTARRETLLYIKEAREGISHFESKRSFEWAWDLIVITLMKIEYCVQAQGMMRTEIEKMISYLTAGKDPLNEKVSRGKAFLDKLENYPIEEFEKGLYGTETFIPYKIRSSEQSIRSNSENTFAQSKKEIEQGNHLSATFSIMYHFYNLFYHNDVPGHIRQKMEAALKMSSRKPFYEASGILFKALKQVMSNDKPSNPERRRRFFSKFFGNKNA